jgi:ubiquinone/menaquinone biosynthesis C-methylase UbiE
MHSSVHHRHGAQGGASDAETTGLILGGGWRSDLHGWFMNTFLFRGQGQQLRQRAIHLADIQPGEQILDMGCGKGTLALEVARRWSVGRVAGIDPSAEQIARARRAAARRNAPIEFQVGVIERLP